MRQARGFLCFWALCFLSSFAKKPRQAEPVVSNTVSEGKAADLKPNSLQDLGNAGSQVIAKYAH